MSSDHPSLEEYEARAAAEMADAIRTGVSPADAQAEYEAAMDAETYGDRYHDYLEAQWQAGADAEEAEAGRLAAVDVAEPELEAEPEF